MKKIITTSIFLLFTFSIIAQEQYDVRKTRWGMSISEVMASEYPLTPTVTKSDELEYSNVIIDNAQKTRIIYTFKNGKLSIVGYTIYGYNAEFSRGTCSHFVSLYDKITYTNFIFKTLTEDKAMKCNMGWYLSDHYFESPFKNCDLSKQTIDKVEQFASDKNSEGIELQYTNERTEAKFRFLQHQNIKVNLDFKCDDEYYNIYYWLSFQPSYQLRKETKKSDF